MERREHLLQVHVVQRRATPAGATVKRRIEYMSLALLVKKMDPDNEKHHAETEIEASVGRFGFIEPIVVDERTGLLNSGHGRVKGLVQMRGSGEVAPEGIEELPRDWKAPVVRGWASKDDDEAAAARIAMNQIGPRGGWDDRSLAETVKRLADSPGGLLGTGFDEADHRRLVEFLAGPTPPGSFPAFGDDLTTHYRCPSCRYEWSGQPAP
jgi:hypothetical protein